VEPWCEEHLQGEPLGLSKSNHPGFTT